MLLLFEPVSNGNGEAGGGPGWTRGGTSPRWSSRGADERAQPRILPGDANGAEQWQKSGARDAEVVAALGDDVEEGLAAAGGAGEAIEAAVLVGAALVFDEPLEVLGCERMWVATMTARQFLGRAGFPGSPSQTGDRVELSSLGMKMRQVGTWNPATWTDLPGSPIASRRPCRSEGGCHLSSPIEQMLAHRAHPP